MLCHGGFAAVGGEIDVDLDGIDDLACGYRFVVVFFTDPSLLGRDPLSISRDWSGGERPGAGGDWGALEWEWWPVGPNHLLEP